MASNWCVLRDKRKFGECEAILQQVLEEKRRVLGNKLGDTLTVGHDATALLKDQMRCKEAEVIYRRVLEREERVLGEEHENTSSCIQGLLGKSIHARYEEQNVKWSTTKVSPALTQA